MSEALGDLSAKGPLPSVGGSKEVVSAGVQGSGESGGVAFPSSSRPASQRSTLTLPGPDMHKYADPAGQGSPLHSALLQPDLGFDFHHGPPYRRRNLRRLPEAPWLPRSD